MIRNSKGQFIKRDIHLMGHNPLESRWGGN